MSLKADGQAIVRWNSNCWMTFKRLQGEGDSIQVAEFMGEVQGVYTAYFTALSALMSKSGIAVLMAWVSGSNPFSEGKALAEAVGRKWWPGG